MKDPVRAYRETAVRGATPVGLIVILYDEIIRSLRRAQTMSIENNIEERTRAVNHALEVIGYLQATLNFKEGGEVARNLSHFYNLARARILEANVGKDAESLGELIKDFSQVASAWQQLDRRILASLGDQESNQGTGGAVPSLSRALEPARVER